MKIKLLILIMLLGFGASAQYVNVGANGISRQVASGDTTFRHNLGAAGFLYTKSLASYKSLFTTLAGYGLNKTGQTFRVDTTKIVALNPASPQSGFIDITGNSTVNNSYSNYLETISPAYLRGGLKVDMAQPLALFSGLEGNTFNTEYATIAKFNNETLRFTVSTAGNETSTPTVMDFKNDKLEVGGVILKNTPVTDTASNPFALTWDSVSKEVKKISVLSIQDTIWIKASSLGITGVKSDSIKMANAIAAYERIQLDPIEYDYGIVITQNGKSIRGVKPYDNGTALVGGTVIIGTNSNAITVFGNYNTISDLGVSNIGSTSSAQAGVLIRNNASYNYVNNCISRAVNHGFMVEQYGGSAEDNVFNNLQTIDGLHGYVSKAKRTIFQNVRWKNPSIDGIAIVSDNITGVDKPSIAEGNTIINSGGINTIIHVNLYSRDYYSTNNANGIELRNTNIINLKVDTASAYGLLIGDIGTPGGGQTYNDVLNTSVIGGSMANAVTYQLQVGRSNNTSIDGVVFKGAVNRQGTFAKNLKWGGNNVNQNFSFGNVVYNNINTVNSSTIDASQANDYTELRNTTATNITGISGGKVGQILTIVVNDSLSVITKTSTIRLTNGYIKGKGSVLVLKYADDGSGWNEIYSKSLFETQFWAYNANMTIDYSYAPIATTFLTGNVTTTNFTNLLRNTVYKYVLRNDGVSTKTLAGWDSRIVWISGAPTTIKALGILSLEFYFDGTSIYMIGQDFDQTTNFIQNQTTSDQTANSRISGNAKAGTGSFGTTTSAMTVSVQGTGNVGGIHVKQDLANTVNSGRIMFDGSGNVYTILQTSNGLEFKTGGTIGVSSGNSLFAIHPTSSFLTSNFRIDGTLTTGLGTTTIPYFKRQAGALLTTRQNNAEEYDGANIFVTNAINVRKKIALMNDTLTTPSTMLKVNASEDIISAVANTDYLPVNNAAMIGSPTSASAPTTANGLLRLTDLGTGWANYVDNVYTTGSPLTVNSGVTTALTNNAATVLNTQLPIGVTSFYDSATSKITPQLNGDSYLINVRFKARSNNANGLLDVLLDIGGTLNVIDAETVSLRKGTGVEQQVNVVFDIYSAATFLANGGLIKVNSIVGNTEIYDIQYKITRTHKAK